MSLQEILALVRSFDGVLVLARTEGSDAPEIAWGDYFFYYAPEGQVPQNTQPYATIVTKNYPDDAQSNLDPPDRWRLNIHVRQETFTELIGAGPRDPEPPGAGPRDFAAIDEFMPHPVYGSLDWVSVVNPGEQTLAVASGLLRDAHAAEKRRVRRRRHAHPDVGGAC